MGTKNKFCQVFGDFTEEKNIFRTY